MIVAEPKQARSIATRARIAQAAARTLATRGFHGTSTALVAEQAGVSQGALFKHFPSKPLLLAACVERILAGFVADFRAELPVAPGSGPTERVAPAVAALWRIFRRPEMQAVLEVYVVARTDEALAAALAPTLERHRASILGEARRLFPELAALPDFASVVDAVVYAMQGTIVGLFGPGARSDAEHLAFFERLARREIECVIAGARA